MRSRLKKFGEEYWSAVYRVANTVHPEYEAELAHIHTHIRHLRTRTLGSKAESLANYYRHNKETRRIRTKEVGL